MKKPFYIDITINNLCKSVQSVVKINLLDFTINNVKEDTTDYAD